jgi:hypothetical protein
MGRFRPLGFWLPASISVLGPKRSGSGLVRRCRAV